MNIVSPIVSVVPNTEYVWLRNVSGKRYMELPSHLVFYADGDVGYFNEHGMTTPAEMDEYDTCIRHRVTAADRAAFIEHNRNQGVIIGRELESK
jgi:hypothetical protein